jgi:hypothetical protein
MKKKMGTYTGLLVVLALVLTLTPSGVSALSGGECVICNNIGRCERGNFCAEHSSCIDWADGCDVSGVCEIW